MVQQEKWMAFITVHSDYLSLTKNAPGTVKQPGQLLPYAGFTWETQEKGKVYAGSIVCLMGT